ncbi:BadF/BadG/BcrA/BcrD ATPase family protein [Opitutus sp. ER46]|uniref:N-acetylglucosamine kinase n=1 Tax=Opitutus sp. ER46 TaxID=2161864 RepID=UPI000D3265C6|nr:BadF/BadG/BcrA/BcrD ATPase family protein [Opitutus sp. ER46]PTX98543.1 ATPase [Opitutus sp. ER46]
MTSLLRIGVDGGGSKTECVLLDASGVQVAHHLAPGSNPSVVGAEQARLVVTDALCALLRDARRTHPDGVVTHTLLCMAGSRTFWREFADTLTDFGAIATGDDSLPVLELATHGRPGLVLHAGTGSFVAARGPNGALHYAGGLGWRFGDPGSGYDIGRRAVERALLEVQGWLPPSRLGPTVRAHAGLPADADANAFTRFFYHHPEPNRVVAALTPAVMRLATEGDATARDIVVASASELVALATKVAARLFPLTPLDTLPAGLCGSILTHELIVKAITPLTPLPLTPVHDAPIEGVKRLVLRT